MNIMIHACPQREWYVKDFLIPSLIEQGVPEGDIEVWMDDQGKGNLLSCEESFEACSKREGGTWHLQDDVLLARDFRERAEKLDGIVCGFCHGRYESPSPDDTAGATIGRYMWQSSFLCIRIPNDIAGQFVTWLRYARQHRDDLRHWIDTGKKDDTLFYTFICEKHFGTPVTNCKPHLVEHIDYLIGGSTINKWRGFRAGSYFWEDQELIKELEERLQDRRPAVF